ncbi:sel1 repeat family protein [Wielerella bovis]|uniref:sel1 repeat family protein n=1 Tax=Wielerella bovis TaxID=2917790 RepID=UPI0020184429|nr:sel1 repeat family protein [Wielerella bovis]ULJ64140.1 sel1 repeat family protein [Wielerella bovis]ULJ67945.1 sel1 repeat family protein [Wielerella bovis]
MSIFLKDFLADYQSTQINDEVLGTLHAFLNGTADETGWLFEREIKACKLDYTLASLKRIDAMLDRIRESQTLDRETFLVNRKPENSHFLVLLAFYCGEMRGRLAGVAPIWQAYESYIAENPEMQNIFPAIDEYRFVATYHRADNINQHFPLVAILERLFPEFDEPEKSVYFSTITGDYQAFAPDEVVPPAFQSLPFDLQAACQDLSAHWQSYLQILPPKWLFGDDLISQIKAIPTLYQKSRVVWGALVQANKMLFEEDNATSCPAEIIYDKAGRTPPRLLREIASDLFSLKNKTPSHLTSQLKQYATHLKNESTRFKGSLTFPAAEYVQLHASTVFVWRPHLPDAMLTLPIFPIVINDDNDDVMILPAKFWAHTEYYQKWLEMSERASQEIVPMWAHLPSEKASRFWQNYDELLTPQSDVLAKLFNPNALPHNPNDFRQPEPPETGKPSFLIRLRNAAQKDYPRWMEIFDLNEFTDPETRASLAKDKLPPSLYQVLKQLDLNPFLQDLEEAFQAANLPKTKPLPKVLAALKQPQLSPTQTASLVQFLLQQGDVSLSKLLENEGKTTQHPNNTTALLCLAILYLTGKHVPQSIEEGLSWLDYASKLGDSRALRWQTKLALDCPSLVPILFKDFLRKEMVNFNLVLMNEGCSPLAINEAVKAYAQNPKAQKWLARRPLQTAYEQGDKIAEQLLKTYLDNGTLPSQDEDKFLSVQFWVIDYLLHHKNQDYTYLIDKNKQYEQLGDIIEDDDDDDYETDEPPAWHKWAKWAAAIVVIFGIKTCVSDWRASEPKPTPVAEPTVSGSLKTQTTPTAAPATTADSQTAENIGNDAVSLSDAVFVLQQKLPKTAFTGQHEIESVHFDNQLVTVKIKDKGRGMMSIQAANGLYCREPLFDGLRVANAVVIFDVHAQGDLRYEISDVHCQ